MVHLFAGCPPKESTLKLKCGSAGYESQEDCHNGDDQKQVDQTAGIIANKADQPCNNQYNCYDI